MGLQSLVMSANHLAAQDGGFEPQRQNNGLLFIEGLQIFGDSQFQGNSVITLSIESFTFPKRRNDPNELPFLNQVRKFPGPAQYDDVELVLRDFVDQPTLTTMQNWANAVHDPVTGRQGLCRDIKREAFAHWIAPDGRSSRVYKLEGVWPISVDPGDADMNSPDKNLINCQLSVDKAYPVDIGHVLRNATIDWNTPLRFINQIGSVLGAVSRL